jgi:uncharacterized RDD family membrane protein YckC
VRGRAAGAALVAALALIVAPARAAERFDAGDPAAARAAARDVLSDGDFTRREPPRPFRSLFERLGDLVDDLITGVDVALPGGVGIAAAALAVLVLLGARPVADDPVALERAAREAEAAGDHEQAVRLRFRAGLLRLGAARALTYDVAFEVLGGGRTPGKRAAHLRVLRADGRPVDLAASAIRNLVRLVEGLPLLYLPAAISILSTARNQRLGDLAAGTVVVREVRTAEPAPMPRFLLSAPPTGPLDTTRVTAEDLAAVNDFLARRANLEPAVRADLAARLAQAIGPRVGGGVDGLGPELVLERVAADKRDRP